MKAKKWLAKPLALGLAIATAVTSMGVPGGLFTPQTAYAAEEDGSLVLDDLGKENMTIGKKATGHEHCGIITEHVRWLFGALAFYWMS